MGKNKISQKKALVISVVTFISIIYCIIFKVSLAYGFFFSIIFSSFLFMKSGFTVISLINMMRTSLIDCKELFILILLIGAAIPIWFSSGVIPAMIYYGFEYMRGMNILISAFILTSVISILMGSAFAAISTIGIALLGIGKVFGIPDYILLGAIVSGAFLADKLSPISGLLNLTLTTTKTSYRSVVISMSKTLIPTYFLSGLIYFYIGQKYRIGSSSSNLDYLVLIIKKSFFVSPLLLLIPVAIFILSFLGMKISKALAFGLVAGVIITIVLQQVHPSDVFTYIIMGYKGRTTSNELNRILVGGGIASMAEVLLIIAGAITLNSIFQGTGFMKPAIDRIVDSTKSEGDLILNTGIISTMLTVASDQSVAIIIPGGILKKRYDELGVKNYILARTISDTGMIIAPLIPWNVNSLFILIITGISTAKYAPYAILCYALPLVTVCIAYAHRFYNKD